jgi:hypothetical protein
MDRPAAPSRSPELAEGCRNDRLPLLHPTVRAGRAATLLLGRLPSGRLAPTPPRTAASDPGPRIAADDGLRLPQLRHALPRRATLPGLQHLRPSPRSRWSLPALRRAGRRDRSPRQRTRRGHAHALTPQPARWSPQLAALAYRAFVPQACYRKEASPHLTDSQTGSSGHAIIWGLSMASDGDFFVALDNRMVRMVEWRLLTRDPQGRYWPVVR